jgi:hypothetical protein
MGGSSIGAAATGLSPGSMAVRLSSYGTRAFSGAGVEAEAR